MKFSSAALLALGLLAGNVVSAPALQASDVAFPIEVRAEDFVANDAAHLEAREKKKKKNAKANAGTAKGKEGKGASKGAAAKKKKNSNNNAAAKKNNNNNNNDNDNGNAAEKNNNNNNGTAAGKNNNDDNGNAGKGEGKSQAEFSGLACTDGKGAGSCNANGQCAVNGKTTAIAGQCGVAAKKANKRFVSNIARQI